MIICRELGCHGALQLESIQKDRLFSVESQKGVSDLLDLRLRGFLGPKSNSRWLVDGRQGYTLRISDQGSQLWACFWGGERRKTGVACSDNKGGDLFRSEDK